MTVYVVTLSPDERATELIEGLKSRVRSLVGTQQYLDDEPHVTLYLGDLETTPGDDIELPEIDHRTFEITGWEVFRNDTVTGNHTLTCRLNAPGLNEYQQRVATTLEPHRQRPMIDRFENVYEEFDERRQENLVEYGFPFIGGGWIPHITVASISPADFERVWAELESAAPAGTYEFESVTVYELIENTLVKRAELPL